MGKGQSKGLPDPGLGTTEETLLAYYNAMIRPLEERHLYSDFYSPPLDPAEFTAKPTVLILGQYSVGKTTMINYLLGEDYVGSSIGPEPTTDVFVYVQHGTCAASVPGPALVSDKDFPFRALGLFGSDFLNRLRGATVTSPLLKHVNFIDTPGILSGEKQRTQRGYDYHKVIKFLAEKVDRIWILFDTSKTDVSDEFKLVLGQLVGNDEKLRIILNKADVVTADELVRVRGALMWNLGKILQTPEVPTVLIGSFAKNKDLKRSELKDAFSRDYKKLLRDTHELPMNAPIRKITDVVKRARKVEVHVLIMDYILKRGTGCPCGGKAAAIKRWTQPRNMRVMFVDLETVDKVSPHDLPNVVEFATACERSNPAKWVRARPKDLATLRKFIREDVARIMEARKAKGLLDESALPEAIRRILNDADSARSMDHTQRSLSLLPPDLADSADADNKKAKHKTGKTDSEQQSATVSEAGKSETEKERATSESEAASAATAYLSSTNPKGNPPAAEPKPNEALLI